MATQAITKPEVKELSAGIEKLRTEVRSITTITTAEQYAQAGTRLVAIRNYMKDVKNRLNPFVDIARRALDAAKQEMQQYLNQAQELDAILTRPMEDYKRREREAAAAEERRINEERRIAAEKDAAEQRKRDEEAAEAKRKQTEKEIAQAKKTGEIGKREADRLKKEAEEREAQAKAQAEKDADLLKANVQAVTVKPSVPTIAGTRARVNWKFKVVDAARVKPLYQITTPDEVKIGRFVRDAKDKAKAESEVGGIEVWDEDSI